MDGKPDVAGSAGLLEKEEPKTFARKPAAVLTLDGRAAPQWFPRCAVCKTSTLILAPKVERSDAAWLYCASCTKLVRLPEVLWVRM